MSSEKVAVVTGSNKGIGYAIVKGLCERYDGKVYLTARDVTRGQEAVKKLNSLGLKPLFHQLDVTDEESIKQFRNHLAKQHGGIDILINNAGVYLEGDILDDHRILANTAKPFTQQAEETIGVNYFALLKVCDGLFPLLRQNGRVINVSSSAGHLCRIPSEELRKQLSDPSLTIPELNKLMEKFLRDAKAGKHQEEGWGEFAYFVSKVGCCALTNIQQVCFDKEIPCRNIAVNSVHPGYVNTDLNNHKGSLSAEQGAVSSLYVALEDHGLRGKFVWSDKREVDWYNGSPDLWS